MVRLYVGDWDLILKMKSINDFGILWVVFAENPQETQLLLLGTPRGSKPCCIGSMQSCEPTKIALSLFYFYRVFRFFLILLEDIEKMRCGGVISA